MSEHAARLIVLLVDRHVVPPTRHLVRERQAGRARAYYADRFCVSLVGDTGELQFPGQSPVAEKSLHRIDGHRTFLFPAAAQVLAGMGTDAAGRGRQRVELNNSLPCLVIGLIQAEPVFLTLGDDAEPAANVAAAGAPRLARRQLLELSRVNLERQFHDFATCRPSDGHDHFRFPHRARSGCAWPEGLQRRDSRGER